MIAMVERSPFAFGCSMLPALQTHRLGRVCSGHVEVRLLWGRAGV